MNPWTGFVACLVVMSTAGSSAQQVEWRDPSPHTVRLVAVEEDVRLEVLDWGGSGSALLLLAGLGDTPHVFDDVAPMLAARHRVVAIARRGHPRSSAPATGYTVDRLAADVMNVIDVVGLKNPVVVGHSFAGEEMHVLGGAYASRIAGLVYVDAAFDRADRFEAHEAALRALPPPPRPSPADLASFTTLRAFLTRTQGSPGPDARLRLRYVANADGTVRGPWAPDGPVMQAYSGLMRAMTEAYHPTPIRVPALSIYAVPKSTDDLMRLRPWYDGNDPAIRERVATLAQLERENVVRHQKWFAEFAAGGRVAEISGGHDLIATSPAEVILQIEEFVASLRR
jgi:non-heme chloroperoxidase